MKSFLIPMALMASVALAQSTSECAASNIVEACLEGERAKLASCVSTDYQCQCTQWQNIILCFQNCPNDTRQQESAGQRDIFCDYASRFNTQTAAAVATQSTSTPAQTTSDADSNNADPTPSDSENASSTTNSPASDTNSAADLAMNAGGLLAAVAGVVAVVL
ncbi:hypothetical protein MMYC01_205792 [Madurella mycetomatis]|uniref:GPI anchored serine-threonine rich protein n=1 Tax=Madurella mycetomatis TaxID=100816 RepID=A0A175W3N6_9PEZI|nr:hypothetical protein MMYC01_205792 [Madurella mycetomatis]